MNLVEISLLTSDNESSDAEKVMAITDEEIDMFSLIYVDQLHSDKYPELQDISECICRLKTNTIQTKRELTMGHHHGKLQLQPPI